MFSVGEIALITGVCAFLTSLATGVLLTSAMCRLSWRLGALDKPDGLLKRHTRTTPTLGGVPFFFAFFIGLATVVFPGWRLPSVALASAGWASSPIGLFGASVIMLIIGIRDDLHHINPRTKLLFQIIAALVMIGSGMMIRSISFFGMFEISMGVVAVPFTLFWLVGSCNAFNFIDGMDGLASGIGVILSATFAILGFASGAYGPAFTALALCGGLLAVLLFNFQPALIFLGDSGSQVIGLMLGGIAIGIGTTNGAFALPSMGIMMSVPIIDTFLSMLRRYSRGTSTARGDHRHIHHCLQRLGLTVPQTAVSLWFAVGLCCLAGALFYYVGGMAMAMLSIAIVALEIYLGSLLGCVDISRFVNRLAGGEVQRPTITQKESAAIRKMAELTVLWDRMKPMFEQMELESAILTLEGHGEDGKRNCETFRWARTEKDMVELLQDHQWIERFRLGDDNQQVAILRLEAAEQSRRDEQRIEWLLEQIRENMNMVSKARTWRRDQKDAKVEVDVA